MNYSCLKLFDVKCALGEGLLWDPGSNSLMMTDILGCKLIQISLNTNTFRSWSMPELVAWISLTDKKNIYLVGLKTGIALFDILDPSNLKWVNRDFPDKLDCRLNDVDTDSVGRIWYGSMNYNNQNNLDGCLASFSKIDGLKIHDSGFTVTNGPLISPDEEYIYLTDTLRSTIYRYKFSVISGELSGKEVFLKFDSLQGYPDGMSFDVCGNLWVAMWAAAKVLKINSYGKVLSEFSVPAINVTNVCFAGKNLDRLFVSSARDGMDAKDLIKYPDSGSVFEIVHHGTRGLNSHLYKN
jgi:xylono-1,5-lactonase